MLIAQSHSVISEVRARDLTSLMDLYETNFIRLKKLIPDPAAMPAATRSHCPRGLDLHLRIEELTRYTSTVRLTYFFQEAGVCYPAPDLIARIYHDAKLAEVLACGRRRGVRDLDYDRRHRDYPLGRKWGMNRFLFKWLGYLLHQGHSFAPDCVEPLPESPIVLLK